MTRERSPNYPGANLRVAIEDAKAIYKKEGRTAFPMEIAAKALGYSSLNGTARVRLAALRQYGLMEQKKGEANGRLTNEALTFALRNEEAREYQQALQKAALEPPLFAELSETHLGASDEALRHHLIVMKDFTHEGAKRCIEVFRETMQLANLANPANISGHEEGNIPFERDGEMDANAQPKYEKIRENERDDTQTVKYQLSKTLTAEVILRGAEIKPKDVRMLRAYLVLMEHALQEHEDKSASAENGRTLMLEVPELFEAEIVGELQRR